MYGPHTLEAPELHLADPVRRVGVPQVDLPPEALGPLRQVLAAEVMSHVWFVVGHHHPDERVDAVLVQSRVRWKEVPGIQHLLHWLMEGGGWEDARGLEAPLDVVPLAETTTHEILHGATVHPRRPEVGQHAPRKPRVDFASVHKTPLRQDSFLSIHNIVGRANTDHPTPGCMRQFLLHLLRSISRFSPL